MLHEFNANPQTKDLIGRTPLDLAKKYGREEVV